MTLIVTANGFEGLQKSPAKIDLIMQHTSWGLLLLLVMLLRLYWRSTNLNPVRSYQIAGWQKFAAQFLHRLIYFIVITQSLIGLCHLCFAGFSVAFFDLIEITAFIKHDELLSDITGNVHYGLSIVIYPLFAIHITAAIYHQLFGVLDHGS